MTREAYVKHTWRFVGLEVIVGLQWLDGEDPRDLRDELKKRIELVMTRLVGDDTFSAIQAGTERALAAGWPGRAWFLEVVDDDDLEVQVFDPRGFMKARCDCPCRLSGEAMAREASKHMAGGPGDR